MVKSLWFAVGFSAFFIAATCDARPVKVRGAVTPARPTANHVIPANGTLNEAGLLAIAHLADKAAPRDAFTKPQPGPYAGREFAFTRKASWSYDTSSEVLNFGFSYVGAHLFLEKNDAITGSYVATNAFGATTTVATGTLHDYELHVRSSPPLEGEPSSGRVPDWYDSKVAMGPEDARSLSQRLEVLIEGRTAIGDEGVVAYCSDVVTTPTLSSPIDFHEHICEVNVIVSHIAIRDSSTGRVLAEWPAKF